MRLSSAFVVVLLLHLVAVGGIYAFNSIKARRADTMSGLEPARVATMAEEPSPEIATVPGGATVYEVQPGDTLIRIANTHGVSVDEIERANGLKNVEILRVGQELRIPGAAEEKPKAVKSTRDAKLSGETYTVVKGDNPVAIARKFNVKYSDLLELNSIDDPRKLQIGQVLKVPVRRE